MAYVSAARTPERGADRRRRHDARSTSWAAGQERRPSPILVPV